MFLSGHCGKLLPSNITKWTTADFLDSCHVLVVMAAKVLTLCRRYRQGLQEQEKGIKKNHFFGIKMPRI